MNGECWITVYQADINAVAKTSFWQAARFQRNLATVANIAGRPNSCGERAFLGNRNAMIRHGTEALVTVPQEIARLVGNPDR